MCACELKITTKSGGSEELFQTQGVFERAGECERVRYLIEGDEGELLFSEGALEMHRRGKCGLQAVFREGEQGEMLLLDSALQGKIPVRTTHYQLQKEQFQRTVQLSYELFTAGNIQTFLLKIQIFFSEEK